MRRRTNRSHCSLTQALPALPRAAPAQRFRPSSFGPTLSSAWWLLVRRGTTPRRPQRRLYPARGWCGSRVQAQQGWQARPVLSIQGPQNGK